MPQVICGITLVACLEGPAAYAAPTFDLEWVKARWMEADAFELPKQVVIRWRTTTHPIETVEDLARLRSLVGDLPDHPLRHKMLTLARQLEQHPDSQTLMLWYESELRFRVSCTYSDGQSIEYNDTAVDNKSGWRLTDRSLHLYSTSRLPEGEDPRFLLHALPVQLNRLINHSFGSGPLGISPIAAWRDNSAWMCITESSDSNRRYRITGVLVPGDKGVSLRVIRNDIIESDDTQWLGSYIVYADWKTVPLHAEPIPHRIDSFLPDGRTKHTFELLEYRRLEPGELDPLLKQPDPGLPEPIRGELKFASIFDSRDGRTGIQSTTDGLSPETGRATNQRPPWYLIAIVLAVVSFVLIAFRVRYAG